MISVLAIEIVASVYWDCWPTGTRVSNHIDTYWGSIVIPEPYQGGPIPPRVTASWINGYKVGELSR